MNSYLKKLVLLLSLIYPQVSSAIVPTADVPGTIQAATEVGNTINNVKESATQVSQYQKTMAAIGTAKKSVSEFISNQKEKLQKKLEKIEEYKKKAEEYKAKALSYKAEAEERVAYYKEKAESAVETAKEYKEKAENAVETAKEYKETAEDMYSTVKDTVENADEIVGGVTDSVENKVNNATSSVTEDLIDSGIQEAIPSPTRSSFQTSLLEPVNIKNSYALAFASLSLGDSILKGGSTPDKVLIVPDSISLYCDINYEDAAEEGEFNDCLTKISQKINSEVEDGADKQEKDTVRQDFMNGYVEYVTAAYLEAFNIYNDSLTFKNNMVDPITTSNMETVDVAWSYAKEMNRIIGTRYNALRRLWSRQLGVKAYSAYLYAEIPSEED